VVPSCSHRQYPMTGECHVSVTTERGLGDLPLAGDTSE
jgi:hypothetical protein